MGRYLSSMGGGRSRSRRVCRDGVFRAAACLALLLAAGCGGHRALSFYAEVKVLEKPAANFLAASQPMTTAQIYVHANPARTPAETEAMQAIAEAAGQQLAEMNYRAGLPEYAAPQGGPLFLAEIVRDESTESLLGPTIRIDVLLDTVGAKRDGTGATLFAFVKITRRQSQPSGASRPGQVLAQLTLTAVAPPGGRWQDRPQDVGRAFAEATYAYLKKVAATAPPAVEKNGQARTDS